MWKFEKRRKLKCEKESKKRRKKANLHESETVFFCEDGVGGLADLAGDVLDDVASQHGLDLGGLEATLDNQPLATIHRAGGTQLREEELCIEKRKKKRKKRRLSVLKERKKKGSRYYSNDVVWLPVHPLAHLGEVGKERLLGALTNNLGRDHGVALPATLHVWVRLLDDPERTVKELAVGVLAVGAHPRLISGV